MIFVYIFPHYPGHSGRIFSEPYPGFLRWRPKFYAKIKPINYSYWYVGWIEISCRRWEKTYQPHLVWVCRGLAGIKQLLLSESTWGMPCWNKLHLCCPNLLHLYFSWCQAASWCLLNVSLVEGSLVVMTRKFQDFWLYGNALFISRSAPELHL